MDLPQPTLTASLKQPLSLTGLNRFSEAIEATYPASCVRMRLREEGDWIDFYFHAELAESRLGKEPGQ